MAGTATEHTSSQARRSVHDWQNPRRGGSHAGPSSEHLCYLITDLGSGADTPMALITGDFVFVGDVGRPDLLESAVAQKGTMEASARQLQKSLRDRLASFDDYLQLLPGHGAGSACGRALGAVPTSTLGYERGSIARSNWPSAMARHSSRIYSRVSRILRLYFATMKRVNRDGIRVTGGRAEAAASSSRRVSRCWQGWEYQVLDTRDDRTVFDAAHVVRAIHVPHHVRRFSRPRPVRISRKTIQSC